MTFVSLNTSLTRPARSAAGRPTEITFAPEGVRATLRAPIADQTRKEPP